jgi:gamma-glutamyltranspeptidase/glutathione hydrolase
MGDCVKERASSCTTHFNVIDKSGIIVAVTQTLLSILGSKMMLPESGVIMNNGIMWFDQEPGRLNSIGPDKRCLSNMRPILLERSDGEKFALGSAGGRKILPAVAQLGSLTLDYKMNIEEAIHTPRLDMSNPDITFVNNQIEDEIFIGIKNKIPNAMKAKKTVYPYIFASPSAVELIDNTANAVTEVMSPWAQSKAQV